MIYRSLILSLLLVTLITTTLSVRVRQSRPRYVMVPLDSLDSYRRPVRQTYQAPSQWADQSSAQDGRVERQAHGGHHGHVDYGAHTGHHGAFGWYADYPVSTHHR